VWELFFTFKSNIAMKEQYDFSKGVRGKFSNPDAEFNTPIYLDTEIADFIRNLALSKNTDMTKIVNLLLKKDKELIDCAN